MKRQPWRSALFLALTLTWMFSFSRVGGSVPPQATDSPLSLPSSPELKDPLPQEIQQIIHAFTTKERMFREARENYTYHQINKVQELGSHGGVVGTYEQSWDILYDDKGKRIEKVTYAPIPTLQRIGITQEDLNAMRSIQPFVMTTDELPEYEVKYLAHTRVDELTAYVFSIRPRVLAKGKQYFQGKVWVDDRDLQIVKSEGRSVPEIRTKKGENLFPRFITYREQIDGKFWFPTYTRAEDTLYFSSGPVRVRQIIKYTDYRQFKAKTRIRVVGEVDNPSSQPTGASKPKR